jgi:ElaB/YqjD/DUF883 family membrane-anchored ribosome-binding protein
LPIGGLPFVATVQEAERRDRPGALRFRRGEFQCRYPRRPWERPIIEIKESIMTDKTTRDVNGAADELAAGAREFERDVQRGTARVLKATSKGAKKLSKAVQPDVSDVAADANLTIMSLIRENPWTAIAVATLGGALLAALLHRARS